MQYVVRKSVELDDMYINFAIITRVVWNETTISIVAEIYESHVLKLTWNKRLILYWYYLLVIL